MSGLPTPPRIRQRGRVPIWCVVLLAIVIFYGLLAAGVTSYFRLSGDTAALRNAVLDSIPEAERMLSLNVGPLTTGMLRTGTGFLHLPPEARAGIQTLRGAEVGIYRVKEPAACFDARSIFARADKVMARRHWTRVVGVLKDGKIVAVYMPSRVSSPDKLRCCIAVLSGADLVVASVRGNLAPILELVQKHLESELHQETRHRTAAPAVPPARM